MCSLALRDAFAGLPLEHIAGMAGENCARVYGLDTDVLRDVAERIDAPTLAQLQEPLEATAQREAERYRDGSFAFRRTGAFH
jgi:hypothetical protein